MPDNVLVIFAKAPIEGTVKTRLEKNTPITKSEICELYRAFLLDTFQTAALCEADRIILHFASSEHETLMRTLVGKTIESRRLVYEPQRGATFHERIAEGFAHASREGAGRAIMIGSDSPTLSARLIDEAFYALRENDAVLGPAGEGGMYLIGIRSTYKPNFKRIFTHGGELANFAEEVERDGGYLHLLEEVLDVDMATDLVSLVANIQAMKRARIRHAKDFPVHTAKMIEKLRLKIWRRDGTRDKVLVRG